MKKAIALLVAIMMVASLVACSSSSANSTAGSTGGNAAPASNEQSRRLVYQLCTATGTPDEVNINRFAEDVEKVTGGMITVDVQPVGAITGYNEAATGVRDGAMDMSSISISGQVGTMGNTAYLYGGSGSPGGFNPGEFFAWYYEGGGEEFVSADVKASTDCFNLGLVDCSGAEIFCHSNIILDATDKYTGVKYRTMGFWADVMTALGASVVNLSGGDIYQAAEKGLIDAFEYCGPKMDWDMGFQEVAKYIGVPGIHSPICVNLAYMNQGVYDSFSPERQAQLYECCKASGFRSIYYFATVDAIGLQNFIDYGTEIFVLDEDTQKDFLEVSYGIMQQYMKDDAHYKEVYDNQKEYLTAYNGINDTIQIKMNVYDKYPG